MRFESRAAALRAPFAVGENMARRTVDEPADPLRTCFQRDRDRIIHCSAFRRLDFKTQVFVPHEHDHFRTRMTHTLEVAQVGRDMGRAMGLNEDLIEAVALGHDLGHPPFGHCGEAVLNDLMSDHGGFEHNRQSLRVVDYLEHPYPDFRGLNLTNLVRECLAKHETRYDVPASEEFDISQPGPLEGQLVDIADEVAYTSADLEDALVADMIEVEQLSDMRLWKQAWERAENLWPDARAIHKRIRTTKLLLAAMVTDVVSNVSARIEELDLASLDDVRNAGVRVVDFSPNVRSDVGQLQEFLLEKVYLAGRNAEKSRQTERILRELFCAYVDRPDLLPERYGDRVQRDRIALHRVVCDYVAGMTDRFCRQEHAKLRRT